MIQLPEPFRKQGQQLSYDGCDKAFCDLWCKEQLEAVVKLALQEACEVCKVNNVSQDVIDKISKLK